MHVFKEKNMDREQQFLNCKKIKKNSATITDIKINFFSQEELTLAKENLKNFIAEKNF